MRRRTFCAMGAAAAVSALCAPVLSACSSSDQDEGPAVNDSVIRVSSTFSHEPYESESGYEPQGFAIDVLEAVAADMGKTVEYLKASKTEDAAIQNVTSGEADLLLLSADDMKSAEGIALCDAYIQADAAMVLLEGVELGDFTDDSGMTVGVWESSELYGWAQRNLPNTEVVAYPSVTEVFTALESQNVDGAVCDLPDGLHRVKVAYADAYVADSTELDRSYSFGVAAANEELLVAINEALRAVRESGDYDAMYESWFGAASERGEVESRTLEQGAPTFAKR